MEPAFYHFNNTKFKSSYYDSKFYLIISERYVIALVLSIKYIFFHSMYWLISPNSSQRQSRCGHACGKPIVFLPAENPRAPHRVISSEEQLVSYFTERLLVVVHAQKNDQFCMLVLFIAILYNTMWLKPQTIRLIRCLACGWLSCSHMWTCEETTWSLISTSVT